VEVAVKRNVSRGGENAGQSGVSSATARPVALTDRDAWRDAALVWLGVHLLLLALTYLGWLLPIAYDHKLRHAVWARPYLPWAVNFDGTSYADIARAGYVHLEQPAFYPLYPLLERAASVLTLGHLGVAGLVVANLACLGAFGVLRVLAERELGCPAARRALVALAVFPTALFLAAAYAESLFLLLSLSAFLALRAHRWAIASVLIALAALTRPVGILLLAAMAAEVWASSPDLRQAVTHPATLLRVLRSHSVSSVLKICSAFALPVVALAGYSAFLAARFGSFFAATRAEAGGWGRYLSWPWDGFARAAGALFTVGGPKEVHAFLDIVFTLLFVGLTVAILRRLPAPYVAYTAATLALVLLTPLHDNWAALHSNSRFMVVVFPLFLLIGSWQPRRAVQLALLLASLWLLAVFTLSFVNGSWVA
jgi:Mannosyltransferase (PIG-V)